MSRKKLKNRRRKDRAQRKILIAAVCIAAVIIGVGIGGHVIKKNAGKTMTTAETESKKAVSKKKATAKKLTINENETDASNKENQGQKDQADDRSEFAVQPGRKVGTTEQSDEKVVYLTLDDGPSKNTQAVLDILDKYNAKATFFVTCSGSLDKYAKKIIEKGHTLGLHTCTHRYNTIYSSEENYFNDLNSISNKVEELTGYKSKYIRFPGGSSNTISRFNKGIMTRLTQKVTEDGYKYYDWNIDSGDAAGADKDGVYNNVISALKNHNYSTNMVLMHDIKVSTKNALDGIIKDALDMGYTFSNINDYTSEVHHRVNN